MEQAGSSAQSSHSRPSKSNICSGLGPYEAVYIWDPCVPLALREAAKTLPGQCEGEATISKVFSRYQRRIEQFFAQFAGSWHDKKEQMSEYRKFQVRQGKNAKFEFPTLQKWRQNFVDAKEESRKNLKKAKRKAKKDPDAPEPVANSTVWAVLALKLHKDSSRDKALALWLPDKLTRNKLISYRGGQLALNKFNLLGGNVRPETILTFADLIPPVPDVNDDDDTNRNAAAVDEVASEGEESEGDEDEEDEVDDDDEGKDEEEMEQDVADDKEDDDEEGGNQVADQGQISPKFPEPMETDQSAMSALQLIDHHQKSVIPEIRMLFGNGLQLDANADELQAFEFFRGKLEATKRLLHNDLVRGIFVRDDYLFSTVLAKLNTESGAQVEPNVFAAILDAFRDNSYLVIGVVALVTRAEDCLYMVCLGPNKGLTICASCNISVHEACVRQPATEEQLKEGNWLCARCQLSPDWSVTCFLCHQANGGVFERIFPKIWAHANCFSAWNYIFGARNIEHDSLNENKPCRFCNELSGICLNCRLADDGRVSHVHTSCCARQINLYFDVKEEKKDRYGVYKLRFVLYREDIKQKRLTKKLKVTESVLQSKFDDKFAYSQTEFPVYLSKGLIAQINQLVPINQNRTFVEALWRIWKSLPKFVTRTQRTITSGDVGSEADWKFRLQELYPAHADDETMETSAGGASFDWMSSKPGPSSANW